jgi:hypothetical protein
LPDKGKPVIGRDTEKGFKPVEGFPVYRIIALLALVTLNLFCCHLLGCIFPRGISCRPDSSIIPCRIYIAIMKERKDCESPDQK